MRHEKARHLPGFFVGGLERIRTAVAAFAELSLATRPPDRLFPTSAGMQIYGRCAAGFHPDYFSFRGKQGSQRKFMAGMACQCVDAHQSGRWRAGLLVGCIGI